MKPDQERVKNLLLDTVTLLCKNSLQYENKLRVEGLLGISVDESDVFFLHISENFKNSTAPDSNSACETTNDSTRDSSNDKDEQSQSVPEQRDAVSVKAEVHDISSESEDLIMTSPSLNSPQTVAQPATMVAGQRRTNNKRTHSPAFRDSPHDNHTNTGSQLSSTQSLNNSQMSSVDGDYSYTDCGVDGTSFDQLQGHGMVKQEAAWDQEPAAKRHMGDSSPWPNLAGLGELAAQAAQATQDADDGSYSQPGCSNWPSSSQIIGNSSIQDTIFPWSGRTLAGASPSKPGQAVTTASGIGSSPISGFAINRHICPECQSVFTNATTLEKHMALRHRGEKPWVCSICAAAFARKDYLESHFRIHTGEKPYACNLCSAAYRQKGKLNKHMATAHREGPSLVKFDYSGIAAAAAQSSWLAERTPSMGEGEEPRNDKMVPSLNDTNELNETNEETDVEQNVEQNDRESDVNESLSFSDVEYTAQKNLLKTGSFGHEENNFDK